MLPREEKKMKKGKNYKAAEAKFDKKQAYTPEEAVKFAKDTNTTKFDATVDVAIKLNLDTRKAEQQLRGALVLPHGTGKTSRVLVIAKGDAATAAKEAGADFVGDADMIEKIDKENWFDFDIIIATPEMMPVLARLGKVLGPRGLMPNPKTGTVTTDVVKALEEIKKGRIEYRADSYGNVHAPIGKVSFTEKQLLENLETIINLVQKLKPSVVKGIYIKNISISTTMGPGIKIDTNSFEK